jgi:hypothetical protein
VTPRSIDEARLLAPHLGFSVYAMEPKGAVTLEVIEDGTPYAFVGATEAEAWAMAFPGAPGAPTAAPLDLDRDGAAYLRDLAQRLMRVPVVHGVDGYDISRLSELAGPIRPAPEPPAPPAAPAEDLFA